MAVHPARHRQGIGRAPVAAAQADLAADGARFLQVKTLGPSRPDEGYERTRRFYAGAGFEPLEEITGLWPENPCLIMIKTLG
jgi:ribosomal protein S18 acetylase RimI-like enzyme